MGRKVLAAVLVSVVAGLSAADLSACGDKFIRAGRSPRVKGYAAVHRSSIVLFAPDSTRPRDFEAFEAFLRKAGHRTRGAVTLDALSSALSEGNVDLVILPARHASAVAPLVETASSRPGVLPHVDRSQAGVLARVRQQHEHVLSLPASKYEVLAEIDEVMEIRARAMAATAPRP